MTNKIIIELDLEDHDKRREAHHMLNAEMMHDTIQTYYDTVLRKYYKWAQLTDGEHSMLVGITKDLKEHFDNFLED